MVEILEPSYEFWENDLEMPVNQLLHDFQNLDIRKNWLHFLSGRQLNVIFQHCIPQDSNDLSIQQKRKSIAQKIYLTII